MNRYSCFVVTVERALHVMAYDDGAAGLAAADETYLRDS